MGLFEQFKQLIINTEDSIEGHTMTAASLHEVKGMDIKSTTFDGWNGAAYADTNESDDPILILLGFAKWKKAQLVKFEVGRAIVGVAQASKLKVTGSGVANGAIALVRLVLKSSNLEAEFAKCHPEYSLEKRYQITMNDTLDAEEFNLKLAALVAKDVELGYAQYITATLLDDANVVDLVNPTGVLLTSSKATIDFDIYVDLPAGLALSFIADLPAEDTDSIAGGGAGADLVTENYDGRNTWEQLRHLKLETDGHIYPHSDALNHMPIRNASYVSFMIEHQSTNDEVGADIVGQVNTKANQIFNLYIKESCVVLINNISRWLDMSVAEGNFYTGTTFATVGTVTANNTGAAAIDVAEFIPVP